MFFEGMAARGIQEIPNLHGAVAGGGGQVGASGMERDSGDPVFVPFAGHDEIAIGNGPDFPREIITGSGQNRLSGVESDTGDRHHMPFEGFS